MRAVIRVTTRVVDFEISDIILYRAITNKELLNTFNRGIDLVIIEYTKGDNLDYLKDIERDKIVLVTNDSNIELDGYKVISPASGLKDYIKGLVKKSNIIDKYDKTIEDLKNQIVNISSENERIQSILSGTELESSALQESIERIGELELQVEQSINDKAYLQSELDSVRKQLEVFKNQGNDSNSIIVNLKNTNNNLEVRIKELDSNIIAIQDTIIQLHYENWEFIRTIEKLNKDLDIVNKQKEELSNKVDDLVRDKMIDDLEVSELKYSIETKDSEIETLNIKLLEINNLISSVMAKYVTINDGETIEVKEIVGVIEGLEESKKVHEEELRLLRERSNELENTHSEHINKISSLKKLVSEYEEKLKGYESDLELLDSKKDSEILSISNERDELSRQIELLENELTALRELEKNLSESIVAKDSRISELLKSNSQIEMYQSKIKGLEEVEGNLTLRVKEYLKDKMELSERLRNKEEEIIKLSDELSYHKSKSNESIKAIVRSVIHNYTGKAKVIPVFGTGSYGITSVVVSLADIMRTNKVLVMDFDLISPKVDAYYKLNPTCNLLDIPQIEMRTGVGALVFKGSNYICNNLKNVIKKVNGNLDYFSGIYYGLNGNRFMSIDFELLMNKLGSLYDYIIVDCGKIGCSIYSDTLIKTMHTIAHKSIMISLNDIFDTRSAFLRLNNIGVDMKDGVWVLNMSRQSIVDKNSVKYCVASKQIIFTRDNNMYGEYKLYDRVPNLRSKLAELKRIVE